MTGLAWIGDDLPAGRTAALNHLFTPGMLDAIYRLYVDRFMEAVNRSAATPPAERRGSLARPAERVLQAVRPAVPWCCRGVAGACLHARLQPPNGKPQRRGPACRGHQRPILELTFAADEARSNGELTRYSTLRQQMAAKGQQYQQAVIAHEQAKSAFVQALKRTPEARYLDDDALLFIASWIDRRTHNNPEKLTAAGQAANLFRDLAGHFDAAAANPGASQ